MIKKLRVTVEGKTYEVAVEVLDEGVQSGPAAPVEQPRAPVPDRGGASEEPTRERASAPPPKGSGDVPSPLAGKVVSIECKPGDRITEGQQILTLEAMKMNTLVTAPTPGTVSAIHVGVGDAVEEGQSLLAIE